MSINKSGILISVFGFAFVLGYGVTAHGSNPPAPGSLASSIQQGDLDADAMKKEIITNLQPAVLTCDGTEQRAGAAGQAYPHKFSKKSDRCELVFFPNSEPSPTCNLTDNRYTQAHLPADTQWLLNNAPAVSNLSDANSPTGYTSGITFKFIVFNEAQKFGSAELRCKDANQDMKASDLDPELSKLGLSGLKIVTTPKVTYTLAPDAGVEGAHQ